MLSRFGTEFSYANASVYTCFPLLGDTGVEKKICPAQGALSQKRKKEALSESKPATA